MALPRDTRERIERREHCSTRHRGTFGVVAALAISSYSDTHTRPGRTADPAPTMVPKLRIMRRQAAHTPRRARRPLGLAAATLAALALTPATAAASGPPVIGPVTRGGQPTGEGIVEAQIDPEGHETTYKISADCEVPAKCQHTEGTLPADNEEHTVTLTLSGLQPGVTYHFDIHAASGAGEADWPGEFTVPEVPPGACPNGCSKNEQYGSEVPQWLINESNSESAETLKKYEEQQDREQQEKKAQEAARHAAEEAELKQAEERDAQEAAARERTEREEEEAEHPACRVPALKGDTLTAARRALARAHCRLGDVHRPAHHHGTLRVSAQGAPVGERLAHGARVALWCGATRASRR
jgi:hypothetical protein